MFNRWLAGAELFLAAGLWGFSFIASTWVLARLDAFELTFARFALSALAMSPFMVLPKWRAAFKDSLKMAFWPGVYFALTLLIQTWGLQYTTATKSGFLTTLYVVFVPCWEAYLGERRPSVGLWLCVLAAFGGTVLIVNGGLQDINKGDLVTIVCALVATAQIHAVGRVSPRVSQPWVFNAAQILWAALVCAPFGAGPDLWSKLSDFMYWPFTARLGLVTLVVGATLIAFTLQVRAQAYLSATVSSLLFLMESPFAMFFAIFLLGESLGPTESAGALLILGAAIAASFLEARGGSGAKKASA